MHAQLPAEIMSRIVAIRLHIDESGPENGQLRIISSSHCQMPAYHAYPPSGAAEPKPLPSRLRLSVMVRLVMYLTFL